MRRLAASVLIAFALPAAACPRAGETMSDQGSGLRPPGNPDRAVEAELAAARRAGTLAAYDLFLARHPRHRLAAAARRERAALAARAGKPLP